MKPNRLLLCSDEMKAACTILFAALCVTASAQTPLPSPATPEAERPAPMIKPPGEPGMNPHGDGSVVVPPATGNEEIVKTPKNVDPKMDDATGDIDRKNRKQSEEKSGKKSNNAR